MKYALLIMLLAGCDPSAMQVAASTYRTLAQNPLCLIICTSTISAADTDLEEGSTNTTTQTSTSGGLNN